jgi:hypothetical protein
MIKHKHPYRHDLAHYERSGWVDKEDRTGDTYLDKINIQWAARERYQDIKNQEQARHMIAIVKLIKGE